MLARALPPLEAAAGGEVDGRVANSPNAYDDIVEELERARATTRSSSRRRRATSRTGCTSTSRSGSPHLGYPLTAVAATG